MFDSIRTKLTLWYAGVLAFLVIGFSVITYIFVERILSEETDENLAAMSKNFASAVYSELNNEDDKLSESEAITEISSEFKFQDFQIFVLTNDGKLMAKSSDVNFSLDFPADDYANFRFDNRDFRVLSTALKLPENNYKLLVFRDLSEHAEIKKRLLRLFLIAVPLVFLAAIGFGYLLAKRSLTPVAQMSRKAQTISATNLHSRLTVGNGRDEIGSLASVFNDLLERLENSFEQQKRFMADASHELRTPLVIVRGESEVALSKENRSREELRESLEIVNDESKRLTKIVEDLFTLSRADAGQFQVNFKPIYLDEILTDCVRSVRTLAEKKHISIKLTTVETEISGDEQMLRRLFLNLLDNAVKYNRARGQISVDLADKIVTIADTGIGIAESEQTKIFERFYRADKSRTRAEESNTSGAGLGLSIAEFIARLHRAELKLAGSNESGSVFSVVFPR
jgi:heavy metal sensor kinase